MKGLNLIKLYESDLICLEAKKTELLRELRKVQESEHNTKRWLKELKEAQV